MKKKSLMVNFGKLMKYFFYFQIWSRWETRPGLQACDHRIQRWYVPKCISDNYCRWTIFLYRSTLYFRLFCMFWCKNRQYWVNVIRFKIFEGVAFVLASTIYSQMNEPAKFAGIRKMLYCDDFIGPIWSIE